MSLKCKNQSCKDNDNNNCINKIGDLSFDNRGQCENYCSKYNCIVCNEQISYINVSYVDLCNECENLIKSGDIQIFYKDDLIEYGLQKAKIGKKIMIDKSDWEIIRAAENKEYKVLKRIRFNSQYVENIV